MNIEKEEFVFEVLKRLSIYVRSKMDDSDFNFKSLPSESERKARKITRELMNEMYDNDSNEILEEARLITLKRLIISVLEEGIKLSDSSKVLFREIDYKLQEESRNKTEEYHKLVNQIKG